MLLNGVSYRIIIWLRQSALYLNNRNGPYVNYIHIYIYISLDAILLIFDLTNQEQLEKLEEYFPIIQESLKTVYSDNILLVGNKADLIHKRKISFEKAFVSSINILFFVGICAGKWILLYGGLC